MTDSPRDDAREPSPSPDPQLSASAEGSDVPAAGPGRFAVPAVGDGGVIDRVRRRTTAAAVVPLTAGVLLALTGWWWPGWFSGRPGFFIGGVGIALCLFGAGVLLRRAGLWRRAGVEAAGWSRACLDGAVSVRAVPEGWVKGVCGAPVPLHSGRGSIPLVRRERRFASWVLPLRTATGYLSGGQAVVVHARVDGATPTTGDRLQVLVLRHHGPILVGRLDDGVVFAADRWSTGTH